MTAMVARSHRRGTNFRHRSMHQVRRQASRLHARAVSPPRRFFRCSCSLIENTNLDSNAPVDHKVWGNISVGFEFHVQIALMRKVFGDVLLRVFHGNRFILSKRRVGKAKRAHLLLPCISRLRGHGAFRAFAHPTMTTGLGFRTRNYDQIPPARKNS